MIVAVIVIFHPDWDTLLRNMSSYVPHCQGCLIWCNSSVTRPDKEQAISRFPEIIWMNDGGNNEGIGIALNKGAATAMDMGAEWLLTMDQDSCFDDLNFPLLKKAAFDTTPVQGILAPSYEGMKSLTVPPLLITSGNLVQLSAWNKIGGYHESWRIDEIDHAFCLEMSLNGYLVSIVPEVTLVHQLGTIRFTTVGKRRIYGPVRSFFMMRNFLELQRRYKNVFPELMNQRRKTVFNQLKNNLLYSGQFFQVLRALIDGYLAYLRSDFNKKLPS